jgi:excisionase family DNA binding protein
MTPALLRANSDLLTVPEAACYLRVKPSTVRKWKFQGRFPAGFLGRRVVFRRADLDRFIEAGFATWEKASLRRNGSNDRESSDVCGPRATTSLASTVR